ncbi:MAG TPA: MBL fold metallo-hydrolase [Candidatus Binatia bacterium]|jgi:glyoxylase-like metal-dependent hydrolase (beta-lactamase superfamily II)|nr:MBL fold metallo-hydrolase [Candidatus Binatia bacterium]
MWKKLALGLALTALVGFRVEAADTDLQQIADALDVSTTKTFQFTGNGSMYSLGESTSPAAAWPRSFVKSMTRVYDFTVGAMRDEMVQMSAETLPIGAERQTITLVSGDHAWNVVSKEMVPRLSEANQRAHQIVISPHGVLRGAFANNAAVTKKTIEGRQMTIISFTDRGKHKVTAYVNDQNAIERVESSYGHPVVGDIKVVTHYGPYRDFGGIKFPAKIIQYQDDKPTLDLTITAVRANPTVDIQVPAVMRGDPVVAKSEKAADGVWYITGGSVHSVLIEMKDYVIVVEAPVGDLRSAAMMAEAKKLVPNKPIKYLINTHHHFDHAAGIRTYAAEGVTIVTHEINRPYFERAALNSWTLAPDRLAKSKKKPVFQTMGDNMVLTDGTRSVELYQVVGNVHHDGIVMAYLRKEKLLIEADVFNPGPAGAEPPKVPSPAAVNLEANVRRLNIDVDRIVPIHGRIVPYSELLAAIGKKPAPAKKE